MIRSPIGLRLEPDRPIRDQIRQAAQIGARGVVLDAIGDLSPDRLSETGRRDLRNILRSVQLDLIALHLPTRRPFDTLDQLDDRLARADRAFAMAFDLGSRLVLARVGAIPPESEPGRLDVFNQALRELASRADHRGCRLAIETGSEPGSILRAWLDQLAEPPLAASIDPAGLLRQGHDPIAATKDLGEWVAHAYATDIATLGGQQGLPANPLGTGFPPGVLDWTEYLGGLEEINYRGFLTAWVDPHRDTAAQFRAIRERLSRF